MERSRCTAQGVSVRPTASLPPPASRDSLVPFLPQYNVRTPPLVSTVTFSKYRYLFNSRARALWGNNRLTLKVTTSSGHGVHFDYRHHTEGGHGGHLLINKSGKKENYYKAVLPSQLTAPPVFRTIQTPRCSHAEPRSVCFRLLPPSRTLILRRCKPHS